MDFLLLLGTRHRWMLKLLLGVQVVLGLFLCKRFLLLRSRGLVLLLGLSHRGEATIDVAWKQVLKCQKRGDGPPDAPVCSVFDCRYPLNRVMNTSAGKGDVERVATLGMQQTLVAVKSYGHYIFVPSHLAEDAFNKTVAEHGRLEEEWKKTDEELKECKEERDWLHEDLQKWDIEKARLEGRVDDLTREKNNLSSDLEKAAKDLEAAQLEVERCNKMLKDVSVDFSNFPAGSDLAESVEDLKGAVAESFEKGFELALAQLKVLHSDADASQFDCYKVVLDGQIVEEEEPGRKGLLLLPPSRCLTTLPLMPSSITMRV